MLGAWGHQQVLTALTSPKPGSWAQEPISPQCCELIKGQNGFVPWDVAEKWCVTVYIKSMIAPSHACEDVVLSQGQEGNLYISSYCI